MFNFVLSLNRYRQSRNSVWELLPLLLILATLPSAHAQVSVDFELVARSGQTPIPGGSGVFSDFNDKPAIDTQGNIVFYGIGSGQRGIYTVVGNCCQKVADFNTLVPNGGGETFNNFSGGVSNDINNGRVAFTAQFGGFAGAPDFLGVFSNVGQASAQNLVEVALVDGVEWSALGDPWIDEGVVALRGRRLVPTSRNTIFLWDSWDGSHDFIEADPGFSITTSGQAALSGDAVLYSQLDSPILELVISTLAGSETLAATGITPVPGGGGATFNNFRPFPVIDRGGQDAAFLGYYSSSPARVGVYKRTDYGALQKVTDSTSLIPGAEPLDDGSDHRFVEFDISGLSLGNRQVAFLGFGQNSLKGIYTDVGGSLEVVVDTDTNNLIDLGGTVEAVMALGMGPKSFAYTPQGYQLVFQATLQSGEKALVLATMSSGQPTTDEFTVYKDFSDDSTASVSVSLSCSSGTVTNSPQPAREGVPAVFTIDDAAPGTTCTAVEAVPSGYVADQSDCQNGDPLNGSCTIVNTLDAVSAVFWVWKDFSDNNSGSVSVSAGCTSGTVTNNPQWASESAPARFTIVNASPNATCTATENSVPAGYAKDESDCQDGDPLNGACVIVNTVAQNQDSFTVYKDFSDNNSGSVNVSLSCTSGTVTNSPQLASESLPAQFTIVDAAPNATCSATEISTPAGYTKDESDCQDGDGLNSSCVIVNTVVPSQNSFTVYKDYSDNNPDWVTVALSCSSGTVTNSPQPAREGNPAVFAISGAAPGATCTATETSVLAGYTKDESNCASRALNASCTLVNTLIAPPGEEEVLFEGFEDGNANGWTTSGSVGVSGDVAIGQYALVHSRNSSSVRAVSTVGYSNVSVEMSLAGTSLENGDDCYAEVSANGGAAWVLVALVGDGNDDGSFTSGTVSPAGVDNNPDLRLRFRSTGKQPNDECFGDNVRVTGVPAGGNATFTVYKDYSDNNADLVSVALSCSSGTVTNSPQSAREGLPAVFTVSGAAPGTTCTATETSVLPGYTKDESDCQNRALNGSCTLVNTLDAPTNDPPTASFTYSCTGLTCNFNGSGSSDSDGSIVSYGWNFGDGTTGSGISTSRTYGAAGTYTVTLTVTDNDGATGSQQQNVTVSAPGAITLSATGYKSKGLQKADLNWSGASGASIEVYRNGAVIVTTPNDGFHTDHIDQRGGGTYIYRVCQAGTSTCSNEDTVTF